MSFSNFSFFNKKLFSILFMMSAFTAILQQASAMEERSDSSIIMKKIANKEIININYNAYAYLGKMYYTGRTSDGKAFTQDYAIAFWCYKVAADNGKCPIDQLDVGGFYAKGMGVEQNYGEALRYFELAAGQGCKYGAFFVGEMHANGNGIPQNHKNAFKWYSVAAEKGLRDAHLRLAIMHITGTGTDQDNKKAFDHFKIAADLGDPEAQMDMASMYLGILGKGSIKENYGEAYRYIKLAADQGLQDAKAILEILSKGNSSPGMLKEILERRRSTSNAQL